MRQAIELAVDNVRSGDGGPFGALVVKENRLIASGVNRVTATNDPTAHAEMQAIRAAGAKLGASRLDNCTLWVTLEPCAMCAAAISVARLKALRFGAEDPKGGGVVHGARIFAQPTCHHRPDVLGGIGEQEAGEMLRRFFSERR